jgi:uncharacterized DUF497 family protein
MKFDVDLEKSIINKVRHGIDFFEVQSLWGMPVLEIRLRTTRFNAADARTLYIGMIDDAYWSALVTHDDGYICPLSVRPARKEEIELYEKNAF